MADTVNMSLDEIIKHNKAKTGGGTVRGRGGGRGGRRGRGGRGGTNRRGRSQSRSGTPISQQRSRSRSRGPRGASQPRGRLQSRGRSQSKNRSRSQLRRRSNSRARSASRSRSQIRGLTPKGRAGLENQLIEMPKLFRLNTNRGGFQMQLRRSNSMSRLQGGIHSRLGVGTRMANNNYKPLAVAKRGIAKRGRGFTTRNKYSNIGLRSDQLLQEQHRANVIRSQTFTRSRNNSFNGSTSQLRVSVANDFAKRRRNSVGNSYYLNEQSLAQLNNEYGGVRKRSGPGSAKSVGSNRSNASKSRGRGRGRGGNRGVGRKFLNKQVLNPKLQKEIAAIQGKNYGSNTNETPTGVNFTPTPATTQQPLHQRFAMA